MAKCYWNSILIVVIGTAGQLIVRLKAVLSTEIHCLSIHRVVISISWRPQLDSKFTALFTPECVKRHSRRNHMKQTEKRFAFAGKRIAALPEAAISQQGMDVYGSLAFLLHHGGSCDVLHLNTKQRNSRRYAVW